MSKESEKLTEKKRIDSLLAKVGFDIIHYSPMDLTADKGFQ